MGCGAAAILTCQMRRASPDDDDDDDDDDEMMRFNDDDERFKVCSGPGKDPSAWWSVSECPRISHGALRG